MVKYVVDGDGAVLGRMATFVAKELLKCHSVDIINSEKVIVSGNKKVLVEKILAKRKMGQGGSLKGPKYIRLPDRLLKRMIRGMLPRDRARGREALKRLRCHVGNGDLDEAALKDVVKFDHKKPLKYSTMKEIVRLLK